MFYYEGGLAATRSERAFSTAVLGVEKGRWNERYRIRMNTFKDGLGYPISLVECVFKP